MTTMFVVRHKRDIDDPEGRVFGVFSTAERAEAFTAANPPGQWRRWIVDEIPLDMGVGATFPDPPVLWSVWLDWHGRLEAMQRCQPDQYDARSEGVPCEDGPSGPRCFDVVAANGQDALAIATRLRDAAVRSRGWPSPLDMPEPAPA